MILPSFKLSSFPFVLLLLLSLTLSQVALADQGEVICPTPDNCYPKLFQATNEWQVRREGQDFPRGIHVQMDVTTGEVRGKLMDPGTNKEEKEVSVVLDPEGGITSEVLSVGTDSSAPEILAERKTELTNDGQGKGKPDFSDFTSKLRYSDSDEERYLENLKVLLAGSKNTEQDEAVIKDMLAALEEVENLVHEIAFGIKFSKGEGMTTTIELLSHKDARIRNLAALVLGAAIQNNPPVQHAAQQLDIVPRLLQRLPVEQSPIVLSRLMYALSSSVRANHIATLMVLNNMHVLEHLAELWERFDDNETVRRKISIFVTDLLDVTMDSVSEDRYAEAVKLNVQTDQAQMDPFLQHEQAEDESTDVTRRLKQVTKWCSLFAKSVVAVDASGESSLSMDSRDKMLRGLTIISANYPSACNNSLDLSLTEWIKRERSRAVGEGDQADYVSLLDEVATVAR